MSAKRGGDDVWVKATDRGQKVLYFVGSDVHYLGVPDRIVVIVTVTW